MDIKIVQQIFLDKLAPKTFYRWMFTAVIFIAFILRIIMKNAFYLITYCVGIYLIHSTIMFLTPKGNDIADPFESYEQNKDDDDYEPELIDNQFKPIVRNMPEFDYWKFTTKVLGGALLGTFFDFLDIPVYTPILVIYFFVMLFLTIKCLYEHMKKYNYNPFTSSKEFYKD
ncbi:Protein RER1 [Nosema granulosis]|uniref:Protein RER1 n=1 Tax=Nosema granulosis TaxID=83296 RepID=A0A9P6H1H5_9MICR|nr:Protein RER1 [Nosema granulosis]